MEAAVFFFLVLFLGFFVALGGIVFAAKSAEARAAEARAAAAKTKAARAEKEAARDADTRVVGVETEVGQMGASTGTPAFELATRSNDGGKGVKAAAGAGASTERSKLYWDFWEQFLSRVGTEHPEWAKGKTSKRESRYDLPTGTSGIVYSTAFTQQGLSVQLYFRSSDASLNLGRFEALRAMKDQFEQALGEGAQWDDKPGKKAAAIYVSSQFDDVADVDLWPAMLDWVLDQHVRFRKAVQTVGGLGSLATLIAARRRE
ncbi:DUF4268 domain-containing protein [uncultured Mycobacterium sp.]|uniref:DUF4268 domain-containing protein n=1 Tax=uncultured Mycobacterium sp. TaxID=171292 RepID=UPI0035CC5377